MRTTCGWSSPSRLPYLTAKAVLLAMNDKAKRMLKRYKYFLITISPNNNEIPLKTGFNFGVRYSPLVEFPFPLKTWDKKSQHTNQALRRSLADHPIKV
jgi:hypothetical protein